MAKNAKLQPGAEAGTIGSVMRKKLHECMEAAVNSLGRAVLPIFRRTAQGRMEHLASCILIQRRDARLLVTAAHVIDHKDSGDLYIPVQGTLCKVQGDGVMTTAPPGGRRLDRLDFSVVRLAPGLVRSVRSGLALSAAALILASMIRTSRTA
jgi:hypothetical protein